eukprot:Lithocolla_globosa_v1_NODE_4049_length_1521_cov_3.717599.p1 type:complete len:425 gc:universal NODE_4049_length_1521_cov_3.717599:1276-2(-)
MEQSDEFVNELECVLKKHHSKADLLPPARPSLSIPRRDRIVMEIRSSEEAFVQQLSILVNTFLLPARSKKLLEPSELTLVFSNVEELYTFNSELLEQVQARLDKDGNEGLIGDIFLKLVPFLKLYTIYVQNFHHATFKIDKLKQKKKGFHELLKKNSPEIHPGMLTFAGYLIVPVQRIPRYKMLFDDLVKHTDKNHTDYQNLVQVLSAVSEIAIYVNSSMKDAEVSRTIFQLEKRLSKKTSKLRCFEPGRRFLKEGQLVKLCKGGKKMKTRHFYLFSDILIYGGTGRFDTLHVLPLTALSLLSNPKPKSFSIQTPDKIIIMQAQSEPEKIAWRNAFDEAKNELSKNQESFLLAARSQSLEDLYKYVPNEEDEDDEEEEDDEDDQHHSQNSGNIQENTPLLPKQNKKGEKEGKEKKKLCPCCTIL